MGFRCVRSRRVTESPRSWGRSGGGIAAHPLVQAPAARRGFTLVEMLTVIVIIGILASLITAAAIHARGAVRIAAVRKEISDLQAALETYKLEHGEYPPDFAFEGVALTNPSSPVAQIRRASILNHLQTGYSRYYDTRLLPLANDDLRWARFRQDLSAYGLNPDYFDATTALVFWLGGLPEQPVNLSSGARWIPAGFHADKANPFRAGLPRTEPNFAFNGDRLVAVIETVGSNTFVRLRYNQASFDPAPYVYFRARRDAISGRYEYGAYDPANPTVFVPLTYQNAAYGWCLPYQDTAPTVSDPHPWYDLQKYQIIAAGGDARLGDAPQGTDLKNLTTGTGVSRADFDNITSFAEGKLEDEMPQ